MNPSNASQERLTFSMTEAAKLLGIGDGTAYKAAKRGEIPIIRFGKRIRVPCAALYKMLGESDGNAPTSGQPH